MKRLDYLKQALQWRCYQYASWVFSVFAITKQDSNITTRENYPGTIVVEPWGYSFLNQQGELEKIEDAKPNEPLFTMLEELQVDPSWAPNIKEPTQTLIGALLTNWILLIDNFGAKVPYMKDNISIGKIEAFVINNRTTEEEHPTKITLREYLEMGKSVEFMKTLSRLSVYSLTRKNILPPPGVEQFKETLIKEYGDQLNDPVKLAEFEKRLIEFDDQYMQGDPSNGKLISGKVKMNGRRKLFLSSGAEGGMGGAMVPVTQSLLEGVPLSPETFAATVNGARGGSYFRGIDTVKGGVSFKISIRALSTFEVVDGDCGSLYGLPRVYTKHTIGNLVGRTLAGSSKGKIIENLEEAENYLGKLVRVRSVSYCESPGQTYCVACAGPRLSRFRKGLAIPATDMTSAILAASMAAMHKNTTTTAKLDLELALT